MTKREIQICPTCNRATEIVWVHSHGQCGFCKTNIDPCCSGEISREGCPTLSHTQHRFKSYSVAQSLVCVDMPEQLDFGYQVMPKWHDLPR
jgi:hypothetical protein